VKWWGIPKTIINVIAALYKNKHYGDIADVMKGHDLEIQFPAEADVASITPVPMKTSLISDSNGVADIEKINILRSSIKKVEDVFIELPYDAIKKILDKSLGKSEEPNA